MDAELIRHCTERTNCPPARAASARSRAETAAQPILLPANPPCADGSRVGKDFLHLCRLVGAPMCSACCAVHMTAGHNALRGSGPDQYPAFDNARG